MESTKRSNLKFSIDRILDKSSPSVSKKSKHFDGIEETIKYYEAANPFQYNEYYNNLSFVKYKFDRHFGKNYCPNGEYNARTLSELDCQCELFTTRKQCSFDENKLLQKYDDVFAEEDGMNSPEIGMSNTYEIYSFIN